jgi:hypothetical protein
MPRPFRALPPGQAGPPSCTPAWRRRQGQALRALRNLDAAGCDRTPSSVGSGGNQPPPCDTKSHADFWEDIISCNHFVITHASAAL